MKSKTKKNEFFKYKTQSCKHFEDGYCKQGKRCKFAHGIVEKKAYNVYKFFNFFEDLTPIQNQNLDDDKENSNPNTPNRNQLDTISETARDLIFNLNSAYENPKPESTRNSIPSTKNKNENFTETKKFKKACFNRNSENNYNSDENNGQKKNKQKNSYFKLKEDKDTAHKFQQKASNNHSKKNNLEILYADPKFADNQLRNPGLRFEKMSSLKKGKKPNNYPKFYCDQKNNKDILSKGDFNTKLEVGIQILDGSNSELDSDN